MLTRPLLRDDITEKLRRMAHERRTDRPVRIESERELARQLSVSRLSLRAAIKNLVDEGLLVQRQGSGTYILPKTHLQLVHLLVAGDIKPKDPFYHEFIAAFSRQTGREGIHFRTVHREDGHAVDPATPLVVVGLVDPSVIVEAKKKYRYVIAAQNYPDFLDITQVHFDDYRIGYQAGKILADTGHRTLVHLCGPRRFPSAEERRRGFSDAVRDREEVVTHIEPGKMNWQSGYALGDRILALLAEAEGPLGLFAANDWMAVGLIQRLKEAGIDVPEQISVIGCDDVHLATEITPQLSTFRWDMEYLTRELLAIIDAQTHSESCPTKRILLPAEFVQRASLMERGPAAGEPERS